MTDETPRPELDGRAQWDVGEAARDWVAGAAGLQPFDLVVRRIDGLHTAAMTVWRQEPFQVGPMALALVLATGTARIAGFYASVGPGSQGDDEAPNDRDADASFDAARKNAIERAVASVITASHGIAAGPGDRSVLRAARAHFPADIDERNWLVRLDLRDGNFDRFTSSADAAGPLRDTDSPATGAVDALVDEFRRWLERCHFGEDWELSDPEQAGLNRMLACLVRGHNHELSEPAAARPIDNLPRPRAIVPGGDRYPGAA